MMSRLLFEVATLLAIFLTLLLAGGVAACTSTRYVIVPVLSGTGACECEWTKPDTVMCLAECTKDACRACADTLNRSEAAL